MPAVVVPTMDAKRVTKPSRGDVFGVLWATKNIDLTSKPGTIRVSRRVRDVLNNDDDDSDLEVATAFLRTDADNTDRWWGLTQADATSRSDGVMFKTASTDPTNAWAQDAISNTPTDAVDNMVVFGRPSTDALIVARDTDLARLVGGTWTNSWWVTTLGQSALTSANSHYIQVFLNKLLVPDGNVVHTIDDSNVVKTNRITLPNEYVIHWIKVDSNFAYFGTRHKTGGEGAVFVWDGTSATYNYLWPVGAEMALSGEIAPDGRLYIVNSLGQLMINNGFGFDSVADFPIRAFQQNLGTTETSGFITNKAINPNGMTVEDGKINILCGTFGTIARDIANFPAGVWEYDPSIGLYQKMSVSLYGITDDAFAYGATSCDTPGALVPTYNTDYILLMGYKITNETSGTRRIVAVSDVRSNQGYFITSFLEGQGSFSNFWQRLQMAVEKMTSADHKIVVKYRIEHDTDYPDQDSGNQSTFLATWSDDNTFTINDSDGSRIKVGDEVEVIHGAAEGQYNTVSAVTNTSGNNYTIDLESDMEDSLSTQTSLVRMTRFKTLGTAQSMTKEKFLMTLVKRSKRIQFKVWLHGNIYSPALEELFAEFLPSNR